MIVVSLPQKEPEIFVASDRYTWSPLEDSRLFGPSPWKVLATTYEQKRFLSNPAPGENLLSGNLVMETGCTLQDSRRREPDYYGPIAQLHLEVVRHFNEYDRIGKTKSRIETSRFRHRSLAEENQSNRSGSLLD